MSRASRPLALITLLLLSVCAASATAANYYDPPGRVARLSNTQGELSYSPAGEDGWYSVAAQPSADPRRPPVDRSRARSPNSRWAARRSVSIRRPALKSWS